SLDHWREDLHDEERGPGAFRETLQGLHWLQDNGIATAVAGRLRWGGTDHEMRAGYHALFAREGLTLDTANPESLVIFPEMDPTIDVPEITVDCWRILSKSPDDMMCASSRMVVRRKGAPRATVVACTLLPYEPAFDLGDSLKASLAPVKLNHPHCARFCVLGGGSCKA
ncbi:MAG: radical SAM protein, partial [Alphaproteobacteria bacterium]|nr:radical SAM protein [Alphaproteobacteria bacterium]